MEQQALIRLRGMLQARRIRLEAQKQSDTPNTSSIRRWERLLKATEREIQLLESSSPLG